MKKHLLFIPLFLFLTFVSYSQWQTDVRLTNNPFPSNTSLNNAWCVAASGDTIHIVWDDQRDGNYEIFYKRSTDAGLTWGDDTQLTNTVYSYDPCLALAGSVVHLVWQEERSGYYEIYYKRSTDGGVSWDEDIRLTTNTSDSWNPSISINGSVVHVVWEDERQGNSEIYYKKSTDGGVTWGTDTRLTSNSADSWNATVTVSGMEVHVSWYDFRDGNWEIYYKRSSDGGVSWSADTRMTNNTHVSRYPCLATAGSVVHLVWHDDRDGNYEAYYKRSTDGGLNWSADTRLTNDLANSMYPSVAAFGTDVHLVWFDNRDAAKVEIYYKHSANEGLIWGSDVQLTTSSLSVYPSVAVSNSGVHVVWQDMRDGNYEIYYKRNPTVDPIGINEPLITENTIQYSPNPFSNEITFSIDNDGPCEIIIYDIRSEKIMQKQFRNTTTLNTSQLGKGTYIFEVRLNNMTYKKGKIIKE